MEETVRLVRCSIRLHDNNFRIQQQGRSVIRRRGYRTMLGSNALVGVNGFYDASRVFDQWYSSGGVGLEFAANGAGDDAIDLNFNWYGNIFNRNVLINAFRNKGNSFDLEAGYSHALFNQALDLRLKLAGYQFETGTLVRGWRGGADITTRDGVFTLRYEYGSDWLDGDYQTVGGFVNVGFQMENLLSGESPFTLPEPVFRSPRNLRRLLGLKVKRNWHQPEAVITHSYQPGAEHCVLRGYVSYRSPVHDGDLLVTQPLLPDLLSATAVTVCWCKLQPHETRILTWLRAYDTKHRWTSETFYIVGSSGCTTARKATVEDTTVDSNDIMFRPGATLVFDPGGGLSFNFSFQ